MNGVLKLVAAVGLLVAHHTLAAELHVLGQSVKGFALLRCKIGCVVLVMNRQMPGEFLHKMSLEKQRRLHNARGEFSSSIHAGAFACLAYLLSVVKRKSSYKRPSSSSLRMISSAASRLEMRLSMASFSISR